MTLHVVFRHAAKSELEESAAWYDEKRAGLGEEFILEIEEAVANAAATPRGYPVILGDVRPTVARRFPFSVYFRIRSDVLVVLAVFHGRRNPAIWQRRILSAPGMALGFIRTEIGEFVFLRVPLRPSR